MLIIEGSDCLGKTTLAKKIVDKVMEKGYPALYSHMGRPNESIFDFFLDYKKMINPCFVMDRFHLGGLAYHQDKISLQKLQIINAWIRSVGGLIVVLYANDEERYEKLIRNDKRGNILSWPILCKANSFFKQYAEGKSDCDYCWNILVKGIDKSLFPTDYDIDDLIKEWLERRTLLGI